MQLLLPLAIFLVLCVAMVVLVAKFKAPSALETTEALCDAILRGDVKTQKDLISFPQIPNQVLDSLNEVKTEHLEPATSYRSKVIKKWDSENATYEQIQVPCGEAKSLIFDCRATHSQWIITSIKLATL